MSGAFERTHRRGGPWRTVMEDQRQVARMSTHPDVEASPVRKLNVIVQGHAQDRTSP
jgi:hypothetical protein